MQTISVQALLKEVGGYDESMPVVVSIEGKEYPVSDVFWANSELIGPRIVIEAAGVETAASMGKKGGARGGKIGGKAKVKKGFAVSGKGGRKPKSDLEIAQMSVEERAKYLKRRQRYESAK
jgi:hypothetical protein